MSKRTRIALAGACAVLAMVLCVAYARHVRGEAARDRAKMLERYGGEVVSLAVASRVIEAGESIAVTDVDVRDWLSDLAPAHAITNVDDVVGREVTVPVEEGAPLTELNFRDASQLAEIPSGHIAVSVPITEKLGISQAVAVGAHVIAFRTNEDTAELISSDALVLGVPSSAGSIAGRGTLTIAVKADEVTKVLVASTSGDLRLVVPADDVKGLVQPEARTSKDVPPAEEQKESTEG